MKTLLIAGSRDINLTMDECFHIFDNASYIFDTKFDLIISGGARGIDLYADYWASRKDYPFKEYPADWDNLGRSAGYIRNAEMVKDCDAAIVVWDGESKGTEHTLNLLSRDRVPYVLVVR